MQHVTPPLSGTIALHQRHWPAAWYSCLNQRLPMQHSAVPVMGMALVHQRHDPSAVWHACHFSIDMIADSAEPPVRHA